MKAKEETKELADHLAKAIATTRKDRKWMRYFINARLQSGHPNYGGNNCNTMEEELEALTLKPSEDSGKTAKDDEDP